MFNVKRFLLRATLATLALVGLTFQAQAEIANCTNIPSVPFSITASGIYCLNADLVYPNISGAAIAIKASNVTIDLNGFKLRNSHNNSSRTAVGIKGTNRKNITIRNGNIQNFHRGVFLKDTTVLTYGGHLLEDLHLDANLFVGLEIEGPGNIIRSNRVSNTGGAPTLDAYAITSRGPDVRILNNDVNAVNVVDPNVYATVGILLWSSNLAVIKNNRISNMNSIALSVGILNLFETKNVIQGNTISNNVTSVGDSAGIDGSWTFDNPLDSLCRDNTVINFTNAVRFCTDGGGNVSL